MNENVRDTLITDIATACEAVSHQITLKSQAIAESFRISPNDYTHLSLLIQDGPATAGHLAAKTGLTTGAVTGVIDRLEEAGLVGRQHDRLDRRRVIVIPTKKAIKKFQSIHKKIDNEFAECLNRYTAYELTSIQTFLQSAAELLSEETTYIKSNR
jgi:DNA-binding MarR family transcriptional regulator